MLAIERRNRIMEMLQAEKKVVVSELSKIFGVSEETIRRDLEKLENEGLVTKSYGGAVLNESTNIDLPFNIRKNRNVDKKLKIADLMAERIHDGDMLMLDASSTAVFIAKKIKDRKNMTIITNSVEITLQLADMHDWHVLSTGGIVKEGSLALVGPHTDQMIKCFHVDKAIISCKGLDLQKGITDSNEMHAETKKTMFASANERILAIDSTKFNRISFTKIGELKDIDTIITDRNPGEEWMAQFEKLDIECIFE